MSEGNLFQSLEWWQALLGIFTMTVAIFGWGFRSWANKLDSFTVQVFNRLDRQEERMESHIRGIHVSHINIIDRISRLEGQLDARNGGRRWSDPPQSHSSQSK